MTIWAQTAFRQVPLLVCGPLDGANAVHAVSVTARAMVHELGYVQTIVQCGADVECALDLL